MHRLGERIVIIISLIRRPHIVIIADDRLRVRVVRIGSLDRRPRRLVEE